MRCRAYPDDRLSALLPQWIGCQRAIYNAKVDEDRARSAAWRAATAQGLEPPSTRPDQAYAHLKTEDKPWLSAVPSPVLRNGAVRFMTAKTRQLQGLAKAPRKRKRFDFDSVLLTRELFRFVAVQGPGGALKRHDIEIGTAAHPLGRVRFTPTGAYAIPAMIVVRRTGAGQWFVSFSFERAAPQERRTPQELAYELNSLSDAQLQGLVLGLDRNVADNCVAASNGQTYGFTAVQLERQHRKEVGARKYQRRMARQQEGSANRAKTKRRVAKKRAYGTNLREDFAQKTTHAIVQCSEQLLALEDLSLSNMTKAPAPRQDAQGRYLPNGRAAKAGLNAAILRSAWGRTTQCLRYKAAAANKLVVTVPAPYSSQECSRCGRTSPDNRPERARFICTACGFAAHADLNAACVLAHRGIALLRSGVLEKRAPSRKRVAFRQNPAGAGSPGVPVEPVSDTEGAQPSGRGAVGVEAGTSRRATSPSGNPHCNA
jgi:putative transposase